LETTDKRLKRYSLSVSSQKNVDVHFYEDFMRCLISLLRKSHKLHEARVDIWRNHFMTVIVLEATCD